MTDSKFEPVNIVRGMVLIALVSIGAAYFGLIGDGSRHPLWWGILGAGVFLAIMLVELGYRRIMN
ncbi:MAG: hypothetical protein SVG88_05420 [Halobacteriales archaeon]|nr:hypothetical protein [Halobacteriales archaeon]